LEDTGKRGDRHAGSSDHGDASKFHLTLPSVV
jgi:hypothetical protein